MEKRVSEIPELDQQLIDNICNSWPENVAISEIWDNELRENLNNNKCSEDSLNKRRSEVIFIINIFSIKFYMILYIYINLFINFFFFFFFFFF